MRKVLCGLCERSRRARMRVHNSLTPTAYDVAREPAAFRLVIAIVMLGLGVMLFAWLIGEQILRSCVSPPRPMVPTPRGTGFPA